MARQRRFRYWLTTFLMLLIGLLSLMPGSSFPKVRVWHADFWVHIIMYGTLMLALLVDYTGYGYRRIDIKQTLWLVLIPFGYGVLMELAQMLSATRSSSWSDALGNGIGAMVGWTIFSLLYYGGKSGKER